MTLPTVTLGGQILGGADTYGWDMTYGVSPAEQLFVVTTSRAFSVQLGKPLTLDVSGVRKPLKVDHVYALDVGAGPSPRQRTIRLTDRRWLWSREWVSAAFNVRRASGDSSLLTEAGQPVELTQIEPTVKYAKWSLDPPENGSVKWTARRLLDYVFSAIKQPYRVEGELPPETEIIDLPIESNGAEAVEKALSYFPGCDVYMDLDGVAVVQDVTKFPVNGATTADRGAGAPLHPALARKHVGIGGDAVLVSRVAIRPSKVVVLFTPEVEVRFDSVTEGGTRTRDTPALVNVAPSPDVTFTLTNGQTVARGTYVPLETLMASWGAVFGKDEGETLSMARLAEFGTAAGLLEATYVRGAQGLFTVVKGARVRAAIDSWRRLYQVDETFVQRLSSIRANRVGIVSQTSGRRARSEAYCDFLRRPNTKNPEAKGQIEGFDYGWFGRGYATLLANATPAPATVTVISETAGIIQLEPKLDPWGKADAVILGYPLDGKIPSNTGDADANRTGIEAEVQWRACKLTTDFQVATVLTVIPASPNNLDRFHKVEIDASSAGFDGEGPVVYARIFPELMSARFAWSDADAEAIKGAILRGDPRPTTGLVNRRDVDAIAMGAAKAIYAGLMDGPDTRSGAVSVDMDPDLKPVGMFGHIRHGLNGGVTTTQAMATGFRTPIRMWRFLPPDVQKVILRTGGMGVES